MELLKLAEQLLLCEQNCATMPPITEQYPEISVEDAYKIQLEQVKIKRNRGQRVIGKKIGLTSRGMQQLLQVGEPDYGFLFDTMLLNEAEPCRLNELIQPKIEGELAFVLNKSLKGPGITVADVYRATDFVVPAFEIVDSRIQDWRIKLPDTVADNASSARLLLSGRVADVRDLDLTTIGMLLAKNGELVNSGVGAEVMGNPAVAVAWLGNKLAEYGVSLEEGDIILSGALTPAQNISVGDVFSIAFTGLGSLSLKFV